MKRLFAAVLPCLFAVACQQNATPAPAQAPPLTQCVKDTDCKGERICEAGKCQAPDGLHAAAPPVALASPGPAVSPAAAPSAPLPASSAVDSGNPKFSDYPADVYAGPAGQLDLSNEDARTYKTRLREAMEQAPELAMSALRVGQANMQSELGGISTSGDLTLVFQSAKYGLENLGSAGPPRGLGNRSLN